MSLCTLYKMTQRVFFLNHKTDWAQSWYLSITIRSSKEWKRTANRQTGVLQVFYVSFLIAEAQIKNNQGTLSCKVTLVFWWCNITSANAWTTHNYWDPVNHKKLRNRHVKPSMHAHTHHSETPHSYVSTVFWFKYNSFNRFVHSCTQFATGARDKSLWEHNFLTAAHDNTNDPLLLLHGKKKSSQLLRESQIMTYLVFLRSQQTELCKLLTPPYLHLNFLIRNLRLIINTDHQPQ